MKISSHIALVLLSALILVNSIKTSLTYAYFELDPIGFIENLCENKDQPELECNGKCHLKKLAQSEDKKQRTPESIIDFKEIILYPNQETNFLFSKLAYNKKLAIVAYQNLYSFVNSYDFFHPPRA
ncbi:hypothetical protein SAMN05421824_2586 [Hyunsoonleella jejuensis]|uniref:Uncharacterized protein n=1 Tax=Hyunsoonleella jejuensis TaxID=419940 RepID=A0A1H9JMJ0_9FLAO|nr:hypothetical protein [Hyunsoonleella jejuensis]SEQ87958.1 hypothetical protein SAMN05421824_2586 [Hyunsoonleella jejuensis]